MRDEEALVVGQARVPVVGMSPSVKVDLLGGPERGHGLLVHAPDLALSGLRRRRGRRACLVVLDREEHEAVRVLVQQDLVRLLGLALCGLHVLGRAEELVENRDAGDGHGAAPRFLAWRRRNSRAFLRGSRLVLRDADAASACD